MSDDSRIEEKKEHRVEVKKTSEVQNSNENKRAQKVILDKALFHKKINDEGKDQKPEKPAAKEMLEDYELPMLKKVQDRKTQKDGKRHNKEAIKGLIGQFLQHRGSLGSAQQKESNTPPMETLQRQRSTSERAGEREPLAKLPPKQMKAPNTAKPLSTEKLGKR